VFAIEEQHVENFAQEGRSWFQDVLVFQLDDVRLKLVKKDIG
jgi:hypothetical protein